MLARMWLIANMVITVVCMEVVGVCAYFRTAFDTAHTSTSQMKRILACMLVRTFTVVHALFVAAFCAAHFETRVLATAVMDAVLLQVMMVVGMFATIFTFWHTATLVAAFV